jgi:type IV pilus assembly protein PilV
MNKGLNNRGMGRLYKSRGFSLLEVLVAVLVLSAGLIGVAATQLSSLKFTQVSQQRSSAAQYLVSMTERMRSNLGGVRAGDYVFDQTFANIPGAIPGTVNCSGTCLPNQVAQRDLNVWLAELAVALPDGRGVVTRNAASNTWQVTIMWAEKGLTAGFRAACPIAAAAPSDVQCISTSFAP